MVSGLRGSSLPSWSAIVTDYTLEYFHTVCACFDQERLNDEANNKYFRMFVMVKYSSQLPPCLRSYSIGMIACSQSVTQIDMDVRQFLNQYSFGQVQYDSLYNRVSLMGLTVKVSLK
jgi:hypothetical protein